MPAPLPSANSDDLVTVTRPTSNQAHAQVPLAGMTGRVGTRRLALTGHVALTRDDRAYQYLDPNGANRNVTLWAAPVQDDAIFVKHIGSANTLTVKDSGGSTLKALAFGEVTVFVYDGVAWQES